MQYHLMQNDFDPDQQHVKRPIVPPVDDLMFFLF